MPFVPVLINLLRMMLMAKAGSFLLKIFGVLGISLAAQHYVITPATDQLHSYLNSNFGGGEIGTWISATLGMLRFDVACSILIGAYTTKATLDSAKAVLVKQ